MSKLFDNSKVKIEGDHIEIEIDGVIVTGKILERHRGEIIVSITSPYQGITESSGHVPLVAQQFIDYLGPRGDARAAEILGDLYRFCLYVEEHRAEVLAALAGFEEAVHYAKHLDPVVIGKRERMDVLAQELKESRRILKSGGIDSTSYQRKIAPLKREMENLTFETEVNTYDIFEQSFRAFEDTPVWRIRYLTVIQYLDDLRNREDEI